MSQKIDDLQYVSDQMQVIINRDILGVPNIYRFFKVCHGSNKGWENTEIDGSFGCVAKWPTGLCSKVPYCESKQSVIWDAGLL